MSLPLNARHLLERLQIETHQKRQAQRDANDTAAQRAIASTDPVGRRRLRGIPCVGTGGLDERRDPVLELIDRERDADAAATLAALR